MSSSSHHHSRVEANNLDPDDGTSLLCSACNLPIFASPFVGGGATLLHVECSDLPEELKHSELHREKPMFLVDNDEQSATCSHCSQKCGSKMYRCPAPECGLVLDVACAVPIRIFHWSHPHRLQPIRGCNSSSSFNNMCGICGATHAAAAAEGTSYFCSVCGFWIHPECAALARVIEHEKHEHPLVLFYDFQATFGAQDSTPLPTETYLRIFQGSLGPLTLKDVRFLQCGICGNGVARRCRIYSCITCRDYVIHVKCATSHPQTFKSVSIGKARFPNLVRLPMKDEHQTLARYTSVSQDKDRKHLTALRFHMSTEHQIHRFPEERARFHADDQDPSHHRVRVCDACNKIINSTADDQYFYGCPLCSNFFIHDYCVNFPDTLSTVSTHTRNHILRYRGSIKPFICSHCRCEYTGASYICKDHRCSKEYFRLDASCAFMPAFITHGVHNAAHFMRLTTTTTSLDRACDCCRRPLGKLFYECRTCPDFALHTWCATLPETVTHKFDNHPLTLTTTTTTSAAAAEMVMICEICENGMESDGTWHYSCSECDQSFHVDCIPSLDLMCKMKSLADSNPHLRRRLPTRLIRGLTLQGHGHDYCARVADDRV